MAYKAIYAIHYGDYASHNDYPSSEFVSMCTTEELLYHPGIKDRLFDLIEEGANNLASEFIPDPLTGETRVELIKLVNARGESLQFSPIAAVKKTGMHELQFAS